MKLTYYAMSVEWCDNDKVLALAKSLNVQPVEYTTSNMDDLLFIAKHRLLPIPTFLIMDRTKIIGRFVGEQIPDPGSLQSIVDMINLVS